MNSLDNQNDMPSIRDVASIIFERKISVLMITSTTVLVMAFLVFYVFSPKYAAEAKILVSFTDVIQPLANTPPKSDFEKITDFHTQKDILSSATLANEVVERLNLGETRTPSRIDKIKTGLRGFKRSLGELLGIKKWQKPVDLEAIATQSITDRLEVTSSTESKVITINYRAYNPQEAAEVVSTLIEVYEAYFYQQIKSEAEGMLAFLENHVETVGQALNESELALLKFKQQDKVQVEGLAQAGGQKYSLVGVTDSSKSQQEFLVYILQMEDELRKLSQQLPQRDPKIQKLKETLASYIQALNGIPAKELEMVRLKRDFEINQQAYVSLNKNLTQARFVALSQANQIGLIQVLEKPEVNEQMVAPPRMLAMIFAVFFGFGLSLMYVFLMNYFQHVIRTPADVSRYTGLRTLGSLQKIS